VFTKSFSAFSKVPRCNQVTTTVIFSFMLLYDILPPARTTTLVLLAYSILMFRRIFAIFVDNCNMLWSPDGTKWFRIKLCISQHTPFKWY